MRTLPLIQQIWNAGGPFSGEFKPVTRATIQEPWPELADDPFHANDFLRTTTSTGIGTSADRGVPMRWWQNVGNTQGMRELPNISTVSVDRSVDQDAASFTITISNQKMRLNGAGDIIDRALGQPGYYTPTRGDTAEGRALWSHEQNEWHSILVPNAVVRVYTGFGGEDGDILDRVADGNLALYGVFLVDEVQIGTDGKLTLAGRDMMKLLIDQQLFPPLVPSSRYPLSYYRWQETGVRINNAPQEVPISATGAVSPGVKHTRYRDSAADRWYGNNASIYGHRGTHSVDGNPHSYALSVGNSGPNRPFTTDWWEYDCGEPMNAVYLHPWRGGYTMYVSVMVNGQWQGSQTIPYDASHLFATQRPAVDTGADIPYVASFTVPHDTARDYVLPAAYNAERVRISFRNHVNSGLGVWKYRCGIREVRIKGVDSGTTSFGSTSNTGSTQIVNPYIAASGPRYVEGKSYSAGYLTASNFNQQDAFGDARILPSPDDDEQLPHVRCIRFTRDGEGYYAMNHEGIIHAHGNAVHYGQPADGDFNPDTPEAGGDGFTWDLDLTPSGEGYWVLSSNGDIYAFGDAVQYNKSIPTTIGLFAVAIEAHPTSGGFWVLRSDGKVYTRGGADNYGNIPITGEGALRYQLGTAFMNRSEAAQALRRTSTGRGYWILSTTGRVWAYGDAKHHGQPANLAEHPDNIFTQSYWDLLPAENDRGYLLVHADGRIQAFGEVDHFGSAVPGGEARLRSDGNYLDYADIIRDLVLWSGFLFYDENLPSNAKAPVYGAIESTGAFAKERLPDEIFDKKPVIDAITTLKEIVGYIVWVDSEGRFRFESPNWWRLGNFDETGVHVGYLHEIHEKLTLTGYTTSTADGPLRSKIIISSHDPYADLTGTVTTTIVPASASRLRGIVKPAMWLNDHFMAPEEQQVMAELIGLHLSWQERVGQVACVANPAIEINDQVRIYERQTEEVHVHYVRGISFAHDLDSGSYKMTLTTHRIGDGTSTDKIVGSENYPVSQELETRIDGQQYGKFVKDPGGRMS